MCMSVSDSHECKVIYIYYNIHSLVIDEGIYGSNSYMCYCNFHKHTSGIIRKNSVSGSSSGSQERASKGVTFATDYARIVSVSTHFLFAYIDYYFSAPSLSLPFFFGLFFTPSDGIIMFDALTFLFYLSNSDNLLRSSLAHILLSLWTELKWQHCFLMQLPVCVSTCL